MLIGVISDTHGLLRPEAMEALAGVEHIIHAGDIGSPDIVPRLAEIAPVTAIRGNVDMAAWANDFRDRETVELEFGCVRHRFATTAVYSKHGKKDPCSLPRRSWPACPWRSSAWRQSAGWDVEKGPEQRNRAGCRAISLFRRGHAGG